jgi:hypothetical protein
MAGFGQRASQRVAVVTHHPGEDLERGCNRSYSRRGPCEGPDLGRRARGEEAAGGARHEQRPEDVGAAALVLLGPILAVLVRTDGDVLGAVVLGEIRASQGHGRRSDSEECGDGLLGQRGQPARTHEAQTQNAPDHGTRYTGTLKRQLGGRQTPPNLREKSEDLGQPSRSAEKGVADVDRPERLLPRRDLERSVLSARGAGPEPRPVNEHAVAERHSAEPHSFFAHASSVRTR